MKIICDRTALLDAVNIVSSVVVSRTPSPVLLCVKLTAVDGVLTLAATDLEIGLRMGIDQVNIEDEGTALIPADKLKQIVHASDDPTLTIHTDDHAVHITSANARFKVFGYDPKEAPEVRDFTDIKVDFEADAGVLGKLVGRTLFAAASEHSRYAINGVLLDRDGNKLRLVATDGRRLAISRGACRNGNDQHSCIVPIKTLNLLSRLIDNPDTLIRVGIEENRIIIAVGDGTDAAVLSSNLVEGSFPPFEDVVPREHDRTGVFSTAELAAAVRSAALLTNEESRGVKMAFSGDQLTLTSRAPEMGEAEIHIDAEKYDGEPLDIGFNPGFLTDALKVVDKAEVTIELKAPNKPGVIKMGNDFTYVIMPVNLQ